MSDWNIVLQGGAAGVLFLVLSLIMTGRLVPGWVYQETVKRCDKLEQVSDNTLALAGRMTAVMEEYTALNRNRAREEERAQWQQQQPRGPAPGGPT